jgi:hypothetical protein
MGDRVEWSRGKQIVFILSAGAFCWVVLGLIAWAIHTFS